MRHRHTQIVRQHLYLSRQAYGCVIRSWEKIYWATATVQCTLIHCLVGLVATSDEPTSTQSKELSWVCVCDCGGLDGGYSVRVQKRLFLHYKVNVFYSSRCWMKEKFYFFISFLFPNFNLRPSFYISLFWVYVLVFLLLELIIYTKKYKIKEKKTLSHCRRRRRRHRGRRHCRSHTYSKDTAHLRQMHIKCTHARNEVSVEILFCRILYGRAQGTDVPIDECYSSVHYFCPKMRRRKEMTIYKKSNSVSFRVL